MVKKIRKHIKIVVPDIIPSIKEVLHTQTGKVPLNKTLQDRISFSVLRNYKNNIRKIENISYELQIDGKWEWVVRYDDHGGSGLLHRHTRISLTDQSDIQSYSGIRKYNNKDFQLTWV